MTSSVPERLGAVFASTLHVEPPAPAVDLVETGVLDSLALIELLAAIELEFAVEIPLDELELERVRTLEALATLVDERLALSAIDAA